MAPPSLALASRLGWSSLRSLCTRVPLSHAVPSRPTRPSPTPSSVLLACRQIETHCTMEALTTGVNVSHGHVQLIIGPMFSGKSTELLRRIRRYTYSRRRCLVIKYRKDTRYSADCMATHDRQSISAHPCEQLSEVESIVSNYDVVGVDEGQFYPDIAEWAEEQANRGKVVIVAALDGTFQRKPFGRVLDLIPLSESVTKLTAVCQVRVSHLLRVIEIMEQLDLWPRRLVLQANWFRNSCGGDWWSGEIPSRVSHMLSSSGHDAHSGEIGWQDSRQGGNLHWPQCWTAIMTTSLVLFIDLSIV
eukprot:TRINITY_DN23398_c0_g3_i1.p1 TRINITY_DN23398_c0_g3~~TRINITY_DN23398_c0_g3_i1.p1  ORF type:complete len:316 (+),score=31.38 TRINITY_DN23398_c0_g3_i1:41-949(+)